MKFQWIVLLVIIFSLTFSYYKGYSLSTRLFYLGTLFIVSLILMLPLFGFSILTLLGMFLIERIWLLLASVLFIEAMIKKENIVLKIILGTASIVIYLYVRTFT